MQKFDKKGTPINYGDIVKTRHGVGTVVEAPETYLDIVGPDKVWILFETGSNKGGTYWASPRVVEVYCKKDRNPTPHIHVELIKKWADNPNLSFQTRDHHGEWIDIMSPPTWNETSEYRIKPQKVTKYRYAYSTETFKNGYISESLYTDSEWAEQLVGSNIVSYTKLEWSAEEIEV